MINSIKIKDGALKKLLKNKIFEFTPGLNVIWGRNGVGKSLLLKTMANYCFVEQTGGGGWSSYNYMLKFSSYDFNYKSKNKNLSDVYEFDKNSKIDIDWSGDPTFYMHHDDMIDDHCIMGYEMGGSNWINGLGKIIDTVHRKHEKSSPSSGQQIKGIGEMLLNIKAPNLEDKVYLRSDYAYDYISYIKERKNLFNGESKPTLLLDEIDSQLDLFNQIWFHEEIIPQLLKKYQIILVSHSIFATKYENVIDLDGSLEIVKQKIKSL
jgi:energy-coupling factor transporter ATP-binding protein EcfA2